MRNPVEKCREALGVSRRELALATGIPYEALLKSELGYVLTLSPKLTNFMQSKGYPDLAAEYEQWRLEAGAAVLVGARR